MLKKYKITYRLHVFGHDRYFISQPLKALCKLHALIRFKIKYKHKKMLNRCILKVEKVK